ncbi:putative sorbitol dehydrogenase isoform X1 [Apostichopus japonicus]|uniref:Sorbitol dehydrogenase n=1 Tax=Stichopus japonicus TaxID=307972 RepID=A0A2G8LPI2_STIJA|nr:putative sorbitol dehydrogenase isoform X1 [Apostichopus japonicus]
MAPTEKNLSVVTTGKDDLLLEDREVPQPGPNEVQVAMQRVGICGSDVHFKKHGGIGEYMVKKPLILGHESSGTVSAVGPGVQNLKVGDRVAIEPGVPCRKCKLCKNGRYNLCPDSFVLSVPPDDGSLRRYHCHAADFCYKLPNHVSLDEGALMEPLSVAIHACRRAELTLGDKVLVLGAGPIGLVTLLTAKAMGASEVAITDILQERLDVAKKLGASSCFKFDPSLNPEEMAEKMHSILGWRSDITLECSGVESSFHTGIYATEPGGVFQMIGHGNPIKSFPQFVANTREIDIRGTQRYANVYPIALSMIANKLVDVVPLITHRYPLEKSVEAFNTAETFAGNAIKVMIHCDDSLTA